MKSFNIGAVVCGSNCTEVSTFDLEDVLAFGARLNFGRRMSGCRRRGGGCGALGARTLIDGVTFDSRDG